ncbi:MAG: hypothetical protein MZV70_12870 [Desulfobacterales bacterium]|nr:hypothetical protein [Desulfobacterales bacterium]
MNSITADRGSAAPPVAAQIRRGQEHQGPKPLAAARDEVVDDGGDEGDLRVEILPEAFFQQLEVGLVALDDIGHVHGLPSRSVTDYLKQ